MINKQSDDPNVHIAAEHALGIIKEILSAQPKAKDFNYGGHELKLNEYGVCAICTIPIAEAQQLAKSLREKSETLEDEVVKEHLDLAAQLFEAEAQAAIIRAEFHNGHNTEPILNELLGYQYQRTIHDTYDHNHAKDAL
jgi:transaldolase